MSIYPGEEPFTREPNLYWKFRTNGKEIPILQFFERHNWANVDPMSTKGKIFAGL